MALFGSRGLEQAALSDHLQGARIMTINYVLLKMYSFVAWSSIHRRIDRHTLLLSSGPGSCIRIDVFTTEGTYVTINTLKTFQHLINIIMLTPSTASVAAIGCGVSFPSVRIDRAGASN